MKKISALLTLAFLAFTLFGQPIEETERKIIELEKNNKKLNEENKDFQKQIEDLKKKKNRQEEFKVSIGASFDFNQGISATDLYYDLSFQDYHIWRTDIEKKENRRWGLDFKLYQSLLFSTPADSNNISSFSNVKMQNLPPDSLLIGDFSFDRVEKRKYTDFGLIIRPTFRFKSSKTFFAFAHTEVLFRRTNEAVQFKNIDTLATRKVHKDSPLSFKSGLPGNRNESYTDAFLFFGLGINANINVIDSVYFRIKPSMGISSVIKDSRISNAAVGKIRAYYFIDIEIIERKSGVKLGIYVRDNHLTSNQGLLDEPRFALFLSKQFSLNKLADFLNSN